MVEIHCTAKSAKFITGEFRNNGVSFLQISPTHLEVADTLKSRMAIRMAIEKLGSRSIAVRPKNN